MTIQKLERVMTRIRQEAHYNITKEDKIHLGELARAIMMEIGTDPRTYKQNKKNLIKLGWIKPYKKNRFTLTNKDLE